MIGTSRDTGRAISEDAHLQQSIADILFTAKGSRVMRRDYGSDLPALLDAPLNGDTVVDAFAAVAEALDLWEPRIVLRRVEIVEAGAAGGLGFALSYDRVAGGSGTALVTTGAGAAG